MLESAPGGLVHGICAAARRHASRRCRREPARADEAQPARRQGLRRGRHRRRPVRGDERRARRPRAPRGAPPRHAGLGRARLERHPRRPAALTPTRRTLVRPTLDQAALDLLFLQARTQNGWLPTPVSDETLRRVYDIAKMGPTSANSCPARFVFLRTPAAKARDRKSVV